MSTVATEANFRRLLKTVSAHLRRYGKRGKFAPTTRSVDVAFETNKEFSDAMAAALMKMAEGSPDIKAGLDAWEVFENEKWLESQKVHAGKTVAQIIKTTFRTPKA